MRSQLLHSLHSLLLFALVACGAEEAAAPSTEREGEGTRVAIEVGADGYTPSSVDAQVGQPLTLVFKRITEAGCGHELVIPSEDIRRELPLNEEVAVTLTPSEAGELRFTCGMDMFDGAVVVQ